MSLSSPATPVKSNSRRTMPDFNVPPPLTKAGSMQEPPYSSNSGTTLSDRSSPTTPDDAIFTDNEGRATWDIHKGSSDNAVALKASSHLKSARSLESIIPQNFPSQGRLVTSSFSAKDNSCSCGDNLHLSLDDYRNGVSRIRTEKQNGESTTDSSSVPMSRNSIAQAAHAAKLDGTFAETAGGTVCVRTLPNMERVSSASNTKNAQGLFPHEACLFVGNLPRHLSDKTLAECVESAFSQYGQVYVTIHRGENLMPYGFCQYTTVEDAKKALALAKGIPIANRPCRIEPAKGTRSFFVHIRSRDGQVVDEQILQQIMSDYGPLEKVQPVSIAGANVPEVIGYCVVYAFWLDANDASKILKDHPSLVVEKTQEPGIPKPRGKPVKTHTAQRNAPRQQQGNFKGGVVHQTHINCMSSIFVFDLPPTKSPAALFKRFLKHGSIKHVQIMTTKITDGSLPLTSGIVEYYNRRDMINAVSFENGHAAAAGEALRVAPLQNLNGQYLSRQGPQLTPIMVSSGAMMPTFANNAFVNMSLPYAYGAYGQHPNTFAAAPINSVQPLPSGAP